MTKLDDSFLLINKPAGWTSFDAVNFVRKKIQSRIVIPTTKEESLAQLAKRPEIPRRPSRFSRIEDPRLPSGRGLARNDSFKPTKLRVGHAGTLDPFATGLLIVGVGREATKRLDEFKNLPKTYEAVLFLGATSDTGDPTGEITNPKYQISKPDETTVKTVLKKFIGKQEQTPPMFSAKKINGQRLYELARQGQTVDRKPVQIEIYNIKLLSYAWPCFKIEVTCSAGTYIRVLAQDIGQALGTGAYCAELIRTAIGPYQLKNAKNPQETEG